MNNQALTIVTDIAARFLRIPTLETRHSDRLDFYDCGVGSIREALLAAFRAGQKSQIPP